MRTFIWCRIFSSLCELRSSNQSGRRQRQLPSNVINTFKHNFNVDDCLKSLPPESTAVAHMECLPNLLTRGGFRLTKWIINSAGVNEGIPGTKRSTEIKGIDVNMDELPVQHALGIQWCVSTDVFCFNICRSLDLQQEEVFCQLLVPFSIL